MSAMPIKARVGPHLVQVVTFQGVIQWCLHRKCRLCIRKLGPRWMNTSFRLTDTLYLPHNTDPTSTDLPCLIPIDQLWEVRQEGGHPKASDDHENALEVAHRSTDPVRSTENHPARTTFGRLLVGLRKV